MTLKERLEKWASGEDGSKNLDRIALPALVLLTLASFFIAGAIFNLEGDRIHAFMASAAESPLALVVVIFIFVAFGFLGTPQFLLITITGASCRRPWPLPTHGLQRSFPRPSIFIWGDSFQIGLIEPPGRVSTN